MMVEGKFNAMPDADFSHFFSFTSSSLFLNAFLLINLTYFAENCIIFVAKRILKLNLNFAFHCNHNVDITTHR
jgi:hypothetical protein